MRKAILGTIIGITVTAIAAGLLIKYKNKKESQNKNKKLK